MIINGGLGAEYLTFNSFFSWVVQDESMGVTEEVKRVARSDPYKGNPELVLQK